MRPLIKAIRILLAILVILLATWMAVFRMPLSAFLGAALAWYLWPRASRTWKTAWIGLALGLLLPVFTLQVTLREFAHASDRASCAVRHAMDKPAAFCDGLRYRALTGTDGGPVLTLDQRLDESLFCGLQLDGWMTPYTQRWTAHIAADDPRLASAVVTANAPGPFERAARWAQGGGR